LRDNEEDPTMKERVVRAWHRGKVKWASQD